MNPIMSDILTGWVDQQAEQARLVNAVAKAAAELERERCCRDICAWCRERGAPSLMSDGRWIHSSQCVEVLECPAHEILTRGFQMKP